jgi:hypothetical protein
MPALVTACRGMTRQQVADRPALALRNLLPVRSRVRAARPLCIAPALISHNHSEWAHAEARLDGLAPRLHFGFRKPVLSDTVC